MKYKKIAECPDVLSELIEIANLVPNGYLTDANTLISLFGGIEPDMAKNPPPTWEEIQQYDKAQIDALTQIKHEAKEFPRFYEFLFGNFPYKNQEVRRFFCFRPLLPYPHIEDLLENYNEALRLRNLLRATAADCQRYVKQKISPTLTANHFLSQRNSRKSFLPRLSFTQDGKINFQDDLFIKTLQGVDLTRLRICPICKDVFWAKRSEASTCSKKRCSNQFHQRQFRIRDYETTIEKELVKHTKLEAKFGLDHPLTAKQMEVIEKLKLKINKEKAKNGNL